MLKMQTEKSEAIKVNHFHSHLRKKALQTFRNINASNKGTLQDVLVIFRRKYVRPESQATAKRKRHKLTFDSNAKSLSDILEELNECAERAFGPPAQLMIDTLLCAKLPPHLRRSINLAYLKNGTYDQIVELLERELELSGIETDGDLPIPTMSTTRMTLIKQTQPQSAEQQQIICRYCKKPGHVIKECRKRIRKEQERQGEKQSAEKPNAKTYPSCPHCQRTNHTADMCWSGPNAANRPKRYKIEKFTH